MGSFSHEMNPLSSSSSRIGLLGGSRHEGKAALMVVSLPLLAICSAHNIFIIHSLQSYTTPLFSTTSRSQRALRDWSELDMTFVAQMPILYGWHLEAKRLMRWLVCWFNDVKLILWDFKGQPGSDRKVLLLVRYLMRRETSGQESESLLTFDLKKYN